MGTWFPGQSAGSFEPPPTPRPTFFEHSTDTYCTPFMKAVMETEVPEPKSSESFEESWQMAVEKE